MLKILEATEILTDRVYTLDELSKLKTNDPILHRLACVNCQCPLSYCHPSATRGAYLKTKNKCNHAKDCSDYFRREALANQRRIGALQDARPDAGGKRRRLKTMDEKLRNLRDGKKAETYQAIPSHKKQTKSGVVTPKTKTKVTIKLIPTLDWSAPEVDGHQMNGRLRILSRFVHQITPQLNGQSVTIGGFLKAVRVRNTADPFASLTLTCEGRQLQLRVRPDAFQHQIGLADRLSILAARIAKSHSNPMISVIALIQPSAAGVEAVWIDETAFHIEGRSLAEYVTLVH